MKTGRSKASRKEEGNLGSKEINYLPGARQIPPYSYRLPAFPAILLPGKLPQTGYPEHQQKSLESVQKKFWLFPKNCIKLDSNPTPGKKPACRQAGRKGTYCFTF